ncbi:sensor histidine kinase [Conexibacter woesei]|uniref:Integral membrane sensor signal transduction histidine kinase n=1 Tax=Conexibacter woesei (strain DSM 14684 / CCUG 47730 / CIP 108061 / JCM 11494 / NBRC 100937 / ID131577) TaxID=469383 RepID=D3FA70_CONWI|nr:sensor histidine kinase [Conexibacter woesei]ADB53165.1 integral membrane sensor signal transduction histidine kinase [Conexibacter woesei DSM 14684]
MTATDTTDPRTHCGDPYMSGRGEWAGIALGMAWLIIPILDTIGSRQTPARAVLTVVLFAVAASAYLFAIPGASGAQSRWRVYASIAAMTAAGVVLTLVVASSWAILFTYVCVLAGIHLPPRQAGPILLASVALAIAINLHEGTGVAFSWGASAFGLGALMLALGRLIQANASLREAHAQIRELAVEAERERFARDLHDLLGHSLSVITLKAELAGRLLPARPDEAQRHVRELEAVAREALGEVRETVSGYRRPTLAGELAGARMALGAAGIEMRVRERHPRDELPADVEALLAWAVREGTTNVIRHSGAHRCEIAIEPRDGGTSAEINDDGSGIDSAAARTNRDVNGAGGNGLDGLRERAAQLAGCVEAGARPEGGFRLRVVVPLPPAPGEAA